MTSRHIRWYPEIELVWLANPRQLYHVIKTVRVLPREEKRAGKTGEPALASYSDLEKGGGRVLAPREGVRAL